MTPARNASTADSAREVNIETASARAAAPVASCTTAEISATYETCSERTMPSIDAILADASPVARHYVFATCRGRPPRGLRVGAARMAVTVA
jgi:hypothetical protein